MNNVTKMRIAKPASEVFEAIVDPAKMSNYWFSSGSARLEAGETITWRYEEYGAVVDIKVLEVEENKKIVFAGGANGEGNVVTIQLHKELDTNHASTIIEVTESGFDENDENLIALLLDNKEGWVYMLTSLKAYMEFGVTNLRASLVK